MAMDYCLENSLSRLGYGQETSKAAKATEKDLI
jgi:hypothetical protein